MFKIAAIALIAMPILSSCEKGEKPINGGEENLITLSATSELPDTKTSLGESNVVNWSTGDQITTFWGNTTTQAEFTLSTGEGTTSATFTGTATEITEACYAIYPHNTATTISSDKTISFTLPATQTYKANGFAEGANPMVAYKTAADKLQFKNLCAVLKLQLKVESGTKTIKKITLTSSTKKLSGAATVAMTYQSGAPAIVMATDATANNTVTLDCSAEAGGGVTLTTTAQSFYIVVPPVAAGEYSVTIETATGVMLKTPPSSNTTNALVRAQSTTMPSLDFVESTNYIDNGVDYGAGTTIGSTTWAPVNCGYEPVNGSYKGYPYGKLYQWGRKYGQGYDSNDATYPSGADLVAGPVALTVGQDAANSAKFYMNDHNTYDWTSRNNTLWNSGSESSPTKTNYDPCPTGWRVPTKTELTSLKNANSTWKETNTDGSSPNGLAGRWFGTNSASATAANPSGCVFFPAAGSRKTDRSAQYRYPATVNGIPESASGSYQSSTPKEYELTVYVLTFHSVNNTSMVNPGRAYGFSVRCVRD